MSDEIRRLLDEWDAEVREHGIWTSGHSIAARMAAILRSVGPSPVEALVKQWLKPRRQIDAQRVSPYPKTYWDGIDDARQQCARQLEAALKEDKLPHKLVNPMDRECSPCAPDCLACARAALRELMAWKESAMQQLAKTDELRKVLQPHKEYLGWDVNEAAADLIQKLRGSASAPPKKRHDRSCPAYGNYQPPYEECNCGYEPANE